eukprot:351017-Chlamydomonas_euryale.AAC.10
MACRGVSAPACRCMLTHNVHAQIMYATTLVCPGGSACESSVAWLIPRFMSSKKPLCTERE